MSGTARREAVNYRKSAVTEQCSIGSVTGGAHALGESTVPATNVYNSVHDLAERVVTSARPLNLVRVKGTMQFSHRFVICHSHSSRCVEGERALLRLLQEAVKFFYWEKWATKSTRGTNQPPFDQPIQAVWMNLEIFCGIETPERKSRKALASVSAGLRREEYFFHAELSVAPSR
jgi:hypothetical protein